MKNIIFDIGNVLISWNPDAVYKSYFNQDLDTMERFYQETAIKKLNAEMDRGRPFKEALIELSDRFPQYHDPIHLWQTRWLEMVYGPIEDSIKILQSLYTQGYLLYALTNFAAETFFTHIRYKYDFFNYFKDIVVSGVEQVIKPNPKIYKILLQRNELAPENCIFIDDTLENLIPAQTLGMVTIEFTSPLELINQLNSHGINVTLENK